MALLSLQKLVSLLYTSFAVDLWATTELEVLWEGLGFPCPRKHPVLQLLCALSANCSHRLPGTPLFLPVPPGLLPARGLPWQEAQWPSQGQQGLLPSWTCTPSGEAECAPHLLSIHQPEEAKKRVKSPQQLCPPHTPKARLSPGCVLGMFPDREGLQAGLHQPLGLLTHSSCFNLPSAFSTSARGHHLTIRSIKQ